MEIIIREGNLTVSHKLQADGHNDVSTEQVMLAAYDVISRIFGQRAVVKAYYHTDPDTMMVRGVDDPFLKHVDFWGLKEKLDHV